MSPGNLYYHFRNKEEIIRALFEQALAFVEAKQRSVDPSTLSLAEAIEHSLEVLGALNTRYRCLKRDLPIILMNDPGMRKRFHQVHLEQFGLVRQGIEYGMATGVYRQFSPDETERISTIIWMVALFWPTFLGVTGEDYTQKNLDKGLDLNRMLIDLILSDQGRLMLEEETSRKRNRFNIDMEDV